MPARIVKTAPGVYHNRRECLLISAPLESTLTLAILGEDVSLNNALRPLLSRSSAGGHPLRAHRN